MYNYARNNYHKNPKKSNIQTPLEVSEFIYGLLRDKFSQESLIFDPCCGRGNLLKPWERDGYQSFGMDTSGICIWTGGDEPRRQKDFFTETKENWIKSPALILCNPPFNGYGKQLGSEVWLNKIIELFGEERSLGSFNKELKVPIVLFAPVGFRANLTLESKRWREFKNGTYPEISSIITLPKNIFEGVIFHSEILIFNIKGLKAHYFYVHY